MVDTVFLVRHGNKIAHDDPHWLKTAKNPEDISLSEKGIQQAEETAQLLSNEKIDVIFSSPFYRTLQTANIIAKKLHKKVNIEWGFSEWLNPNWFGTFPSLMSTEEASEVFPMINKEYISFTKPKYPELYDSVHVYDRVKRTLMKILEDYSGSILIVGHGASVYQSARVLMDPPIGVRIEMCAVNKFVHRNGAWTLEYASIEHLSSPDIELNL